MLFTVRFTTYPRPESTPYSWWAGFTATSYEETERFLQSDAMRATIEGFRTSHYSEVIDIQIVELTVKGSTEFAY